MGAVQTPISGTKLLLSIGSRHAVLAKFTSIATTDTWDTGLGKVEAIFVTCAVGGPIVGATYSGGTVTFSIASGPALNAMILAIGLA